jgi:hypothetical protein
MQRLKKRVPFLIGLVLSAVLACAPAVWGQTTGRIEGRVADSTGGVLPGVTVTVSSPALQGVRTAVTDSSGDYRFPTLPPGRYTVKAELAGFKTTEQSEVVVGIDRTVEINLTMPVGTVTENVVVQGASPLIDTTSTTTGINATAEFFSRLPSRRDFYAVAQFAPGVSTDNSGTTIAGSTGAENSYIIEGLNTTGVSYGDRGKTLNQDFVDEVEVKTGGLPAEYGRMTGGVINVLTKSGSNTFHGSLFGFAEGGGLQSKDNTRDLRPATTTTVTNTAHLWDFGGSVGGYIVKDRLWFFGAWNPQQRKTNTVVIRELSDPTSPALGSNTPTTYNTQLYSFKATYKIQNNHTLVFSTFGDPGKATGVIYNISGPASTWEGTNTTGGNDAVLRYDGVLNSTSFLRAQFARHTEKDLTGGAGRDIAGTINQRVVPNETSGGFTYIEDDHFYRDVFKADFSKILRANEIKVGMDYENITSNVDKYQGGAGQRIYLLHSASRDVDYVRHRYYVNDQAPDFSRSDPTTWQIQIPLHMEPRIKNWSVYGQDTIKVKRLTLNVGLRWEQQWMNDRAGNQALKLNKNWAPRLGGIYDPTGDGKTKIYANWGRFYEAIPMDMGIRSFGGELTAFAYNLDPSPNNIVPLPYSATIPLPPGTVPARSSLNGGATPVDPNLRGQYVDEVLVGFEREVAPNITVGVKYAHRNLGRVIEDFLIPTEGNYFIANPGSGLGSEMAFYDIWDYPDHIAKAPKAKRVYDSVEFTARKRFSNGWQLIASYVWSKLEGNYDGTFQASTGQLDPNINSAYDYADFLVNADGPLSNDRRNFLKLDGSYEVTHGAATGLNFGGSFYYATGFPLTAMGYSVGYANNEYYLSPRGSLGRSPADWEASIHLAYPIRFGNSFRLEPIVDVFNLFNRQAIRQYDERYNRPSDGPCGGVPDGLCADSGALLTVGNTLIPVAQLSDPRQTAANPDFLKAGVRFTGQRSIRLGVRFTF